MFVVEVDMDNFHICCWIGKDFGVNVVILKSVFLRECLFDGEVVEIIKKGVIREFSIMNGPG